LLVLRLVAEGKIAWAFWPPETDLVAVQCDESNGIWVRRGAEQHGQDLDECDDWESGDEIDVEEIETDDEESEQESEEDGTQNDENDDSQDADVKSSTFGRFDVLAIDS